MAQKRNTDSRIEKKDDFISVVVVSRTDFDDYTEYFHALSAILEARFVNYEIIVVDNALPIGRFNKLVVLIHELPCIRIIRLSREYSHDTAVMAGLDASIGDHTVITDPMLETFDNIIEAVTLNKKVDIVQGVAEWKSKKISHLSLGRRLFYWYNRRYLSIDVPSNATYFITLSRRAVRAITTSSRHDGHIRHIIKTIGYSYSQLAYTTKSDPTQDRNLKTGIIEALEVVSSHSTHPLRLMSWVGFFTSIVNLLYAFYVIAVALLKQDVAEGWTTMSLQLSGMFFLLFLFLVVLAEYIGKTLNESRRDARYLIMDELISNVSLIDAERKNVTKD